MLAHLWGGYHHLDIHRYLNLVGMELRKRRSIGIRSTSFGHWDKFTQPQFRGA
jgi:hypothetical protein